MVDTNAEGTQKRVARVLKSYKELYENDASLDSDVTIEADDPRCYNRFTCTETGVEIEMVLEPSGSEPHVFVALSAGDLIETGQRGAGTEFDAFDSNIAPILRNADGYGYLQSQSQMDELRTYKLPLA